MIVSARTIRVEIQRVRNVAKILAENARRNLHHEEEDDGDD
jgi:hypothetical protein